MTWPTFKLTPPISLSRKTPRSRCLIRTLKSHPRKSGTPTFPVSMECPELLGIQMYERRDSWIWILLSTSPVRHRCFQSYSECNTLTNHPSQKEDSFYIPKLLAVMSGIYAMSCILCHKLKVTGFLSYPQYKKIIPGIKENEISKVVWY